MKFFRLSLNINLILSRVTESKTEDFPVGSIVFGMFGWRTHTNVNPANFPSNNLYVMPDLGDLPVSLGVGYLSTTGNTAYFGVQEICQLKEGEIFAVTAAAGSVGTLAGQIAKIKGCKVIGFAGSDEKCQRLEGELGFDKAINYKKDDIDKALKEAAPEGIDCFFDNVGGQLAVEIMPHMKMYGRIATCGALSEYITQEETKIRSPSREFILKQLSIQGFMFYRWVDRWQEGIQQTLAWIKEGKIKYCETITEGFENLPQAFIDVLHGKNFGKAVVKVQ